MILILIFPFRPKTTGKIYIVSVGHVHQKKKKKESVFIHDNYIGQMVERFKTVTSLKIRRGNEFESRT